jgi:hypothetical protein
MKRWAKPAKHMDMTGLAEAVRDQRQWCAFGKVGKGPNGEPHFEIDQENQEILLSVYLQPDQQWMPCLFATAGGAGAVLVTIPEEGDQVAIIIPSGEIDFLPMVVAVVPARPLHARISTQRTVLLSTKPIEIIGPSVVIGSDTATVSASPNTGVLNGQAIDPFTGATHFALGNASTKVKAEK